MPHLLGAVARGQIENFNSIILKKKKTIGEYYQRVFKETNHYCILQKSSSKSRSAYWLNAIYFKKINKIKLRKLGKFLNENKIEVRSGFWPLSNMKAFKSIKAFQNSVSQELFEKILVLPSNINLTLKDINFFKNKIDYYLKLK